MTHCLTWIWSLRVIVVASSHFAHKRMIFSLFRQVLRALLLGGMLVSMVGTMTHCTHMEATPDDADGLFKEAEEAFKDGRHLIAIERYRDLKNRFPYSNKSVEAELRIADAHFAMEGYIEAEGAYEVFKELHPSHPKMDYVQYQIAMSHYNQIPENSARDLTSALYAMDAFEEVWEKFPNSTYVEKSKEYHQEARKRLAEHENYVAAFYFDRRHYLSASYRYAALLQDYPNLGYEEEALFRLGHCYLNIRMFSNARDAFNRLINQFPKSSFRSESESLLNRMGKN